MASPPAALLPITVLRASDWPKWESLGRVLGSGRHHEPSYAEYCPLCTPVGSRLPFLPHAHFTPPKTNQGRQHFLPPDPAESVPTILDGFQSQEAGAGRTVELPCAAAGYPSPAVRWLKDGRPLPTDSRWTKRITGLTISDLRTEDSGTYICEVTNTFGSAEATGTLMVIGEWGKALCLPHPWK